MSTLELDEPADDCRTRVSAIPPSCVHEVFRTVDAWQRDTGRQAIRLHVGEPHFGPPATVIDALGAAARDGRTRYTSAEGTPELREALVAKLVDRNGHRTDPDLVFVCPGSAQGLAAVMQSLAAADTEVLLPAVHWPVHLQQCLLAGMRPAFYPLDAQLRPDLEALAQVGGRQPRVLLVNSPANPTGAVCDAAHLAALLQLAQRRGWQVISDEAYEDFVFGADHVSMAALERDVPPAERRVFSAFSFSKSFGMTGYRLGYVVAPNRQRAAALRVVQEASIVCPPTPIQFAGLAALADTDATARNGARLRAARDMCLGPLVQCGLLDRLPEGGWYVLLDVGRTGLDADGFAGALLEEQAVSLAPARGFSLRPQFGADGWIRSVEADADADRYLRLAYCGDPDALLDAVHRIAAFVRKVG